MPVITVEAAQGKKIKLAKGLPTTLKLDDDATVADLKKAIKKQFSNFGVSRQRLTLASKEALVNERRLGDLGDTTVYLKDMGPQLSWRLVYFIEYLGPLWIGPLFYYYPQIYSLVYPGTYEHSNMQKLIFALVIIHYIKREFETLFVHRFSNDTMPFFNIFKNSGHYWGLSGVLLCGSTFGPWYSKNALQGTLRDDPTYLSGLLAVWVFAQLSNLTTHIKLRNLRPAGTRVRAIPYGYGFNWITCPNYTFETIAWLSVLAMSWDPMTLIFIIVGTVQMTFWAIKKHKNYKKEFGKEYPKRWVVWPPFL